MQRTGTRFTLYLREGAEEVLAGFEKERSPRINQVVQDYMGFVEHLVPGLTAAQWRVLVDLVDGDPKMLEELRTVALLWGVVLTQQDAAQARGVDASELAAHLRSFSDPEQRALREVLWRVRARIEQGLDFSVALQLAGAPVVDASSEAKPATKQTGRKSLRSGS
ncbi:hypothetical protein [Denitratimonas sp. CY0512]|uniref:hypothetical protein n=1 Tax=Denitratimonas sp. CY0512 TaxID=3131940 RepID=UPI0030B59E22